MWSVDTDYLRCDPNIIPYIEVEFSKRLKDYADLLQGIGLRPPYKWVGGVTGVKGRRFTIPPVQGQVSILGFNNYICLSDTVMAEGTYDGVQTPANALYPLFKSIFDKCGIQRPTYLPR